MRRLPLLLLCALLPLSASALEYKNLSLLYTDAPFLPADAAGISVLTSLGAVEGNPDGTFRSSDRVNRAEFLKIVLARHPRIRVSSADATRCFRDVGPNDWFSPYVCLAKKRGMVGGYPDGEFKPARSVNYAEALKMLGELYNYVGFDAGDEAWYMQYVRAAQFHKTSLPVALPYDRALTRGQMARLAAAYRAHEDGELELYRLAERDIDLVIAEQRKVEEEIREEEEPAPQEPEPAQPEIEEPRTVELPARSRQILLGERAIIADGFFQPRNEKAFFNSVTIKLRKESRAIAELYLVDEEGNKVMTLSKDIYDDEERTWKGQATSGNPYFIAPVGETFALEARIKARDAEGFPNELIQVKWMSAVISPENKKTESYQIVAAQPHYPPHQTVQARVTSVKSTYIMTGSLSLGQGGQLLARFEIAGDVLDGAQLWIDDLLFTVESSEDVIVRNMRLNRDHECTVGFKTVNCSGIPQEMGLIADTSGRNLPLVFELYGDVSYDKDEVRRFLTIDLLKPGTLSMPGSPGEDGAVHWNDGSGRYLWVDLPTPLAIGTTWR